MIPDEIPRADPFRWYCRLCGSGGEHELRDTRDRLAQEHLERSDCGLGIRLGKAETGRVLEVWTYTPRDVKRALRMANPVGVARMDELVAFLLARIADDAQVARDAVEGHGQQWTQGDQDAPTGTRTFVQLGDQHQLSVKFPDETGAAHGARWDPARVLAECDAKRLLAEQLRRSVRSVGPDLSVPALQVARAFARAHRDHPDYRPEWDD